MGSSLKTYAFFLFLTLSKLPRKPFLVGNIYFTYSRTGLLTSWPSSHSSIILQSLPVKIVRNFYSFRNHQLSRILHLRGKQISGQYPESKAITLQETDQVF